MNQVPTVHPSASSNDNDSVFTVSHASASLKTQQCQRKGMISGSNPLSPRQDLDMVEQVENIVNHRKEKLVCANYDDYQVTLTTAYNHRCFCIALVNETHKQRKEALFGFSSPATPMIQMECSVESSSSTAFTSSTNSSSSSDLLSSSCGSAAAAVPRGSPLSAIRRRARLFNELKNETAELRQMIHEKYQQAAAASASAQKKKSSKKKASNAVLAAQDPYRDILSVISAKRLFQDM